MINPPAGWDTYWANPDSELRLFINVTLRNNITLQFQNADLESCSVEGSLFGDLSVGNVCSSRLSFVIKSAGSNINAIEPGSQVKLTCQLGPRGSASHTSSVSQGTYYVSEVIPNHNGSAKVVAYDEITKISDYVIPGEPYLIEIGTYLLYVHERYQIAANRSALISAVVKDKTGIISDSDSAIFGNIRIPNYPKTTTRKMLETAAALAGGNIAIGKNNAIRLYRLDTGDSITTTPEGIVITASSLKKDERSQPITGVNLIEGDTTYPSGSGWRIDARIDDVLEIGASSDLAKTVSNNMHSDIDATNYQKVTLRASNVRAEGVYVTPLFELGDRVSVDIGNGKYYNFTASDYKVDYVNGCWGYIGRNKSADAIKYSIENTWSSIYGWEEGWTTAVINTASYSIDILDNNVFRLNPDRIRITSSSAGKNVVKITGGLNPISVTFQYVSTQDGQTKSASVTAYIINDYYPVESDNGTLSYISNLLFCCSSLPDDAVGASVVGNPITLKSDQVSGGTVSALLSKN